MIDFKYRILFACGLWNIHITGGDWSIMVTVLVVDDHEDMKELLRQHFSGKKCQVYAADDLDSVRHLLSEVTIDVAIVDVRLEGYPKEGLAVLSLLKEQRKETMVIVMTANASASIGKSMSIKDEALRRGADDFIQKSATRLCDDLDKSIHEHLLCRSSPSDSRLAYPVKVKEEIYRSPLPIPDPLYNALCEVLLQCGVFDSDGSLKTVFVVKSIHLWRDDLPQAASSRKRVEATIDYLYDKCNSRGENALVLFVDVLANRFSSDDGLHHELTRISEHLSSLKVGTSES